MLIDNHHRHITYARIAVTDKCNLRCQYCMPEEGLTWAKRSELLSWEEMEMLCEVLSELGIEKLRITGGEPFLRKNIMGFLENISKKNLFQKISITTNGVLTRPYLKELKSLGITSINLSLDTLDRTKFLQITRRDAFDEVMLCLQEMIALQFEVKVNAVVMTGINEDEIEALASLALQLPIDVRFIEEMPFNGGYKSVSAVWTHHTILQHLKNSLGELEPLPTLNGQTAVEYRIPGFKGKIGIIAAFSRTFCGSCNRLRITPKGDLKTCLYALGSISLRDELRHSGAEAVKSLIQHAVGNRAKDGFEAESMNEHESMSTIGG